MKFRNKLNFYLLSTLVFLNFANFVKAADQDLNKWDSICLQGALKKRSDIRLGLKEVIALNSQAGLVVSIHKCVYRLKFEPRIMISLTTLSNAFMLTPTEYYTRLQNDSHPNIVNVPIESSWILNYLMEGRLFSIILSATPKS